MHDRKYISWGAGWIPFDASTRPDLPLPAELTKAPLSGLSSLLDQRLGDNLAAGKTPGSIMKSLEFAMKNGIGWGLFAFVAVGTVAMLVWYLFFYKKRTSIKPVNFDYSAIDGNDYKAVIAAFALVEKQLAKTVSGVVCRTSRIVNTRSPLNFMQVNSPIR